MDLSLTLSQKQILSQRMQQSAEILQMSTLTLSEYIQDLTIENPVMEFETDFPDPEDSFVKLREKLEWLDGTDEQNKPYYQEEQEENEDWKFRQSEKEGLREYLLSQINILPCKGSRLRLARFLAESVDDSGYLDAGALCKVEERFGLSSQEVEEVLALLQSMEPAGVGARDLKECLLLQLNRLPVQYPLCENIIENYLEELAKNQLHVIAKKLKVKIIEVVTAKEIITKLNPKPGSGFAQEDGTDYIIPDAVIKKQGDELFVILNKDYIPQIKISSYYKDVLLGNTSNAAKEYIAGKIRQAEWVMQCVQKRESTLLRTIQTIVSWQDAFFQEKGGQLRPLRLSDVAETMGVHESTVSRAIRDKYLQCDRGVFPLQQFFTTGVATSNTGTISADSIKQMIQNIIQNEDKSAPLSDQKLTDQLNAMDVQIKRRTVTKYREAMGIPGTSVRKEY